MLQLQAVRMGVQASGRYIGTFARLQIHPIDPTRVQKAMSCFKLPLMLMCIICWLSCLRRPASVLRLPLGGFAGTASRHWYDITPSRRSALVQRATVSPSIARTALFLCCVQVASVLRSQRPPSCFTIAPVSHQSLTAHCGSSTNNAVQHAVDTAKHTCNACYHQARPPEQV